MSGQRQASIQKFFTLYTLAFYTVFFLGLSFFHYAGLIAAHCVSINVTAFLLMGFDKGFARKNALRIPELVFFVMALLGGAAGVLAGGASFRHKIRKAHFQLILVVILLLQIGLYKLVLQ